MRSRSRLLDIPGVDLILDLNLLKLTSMHTVTFKCGKFFKRHSELFFIIAFIACDCFLSGWALTAGTVAAILYVVLPAIRTIWGLSPIERVTFLKAFVKTPKVQRLGVLLFWIYSIRFLIYATTSSRLFTVVDSKHLLPSTTGALIMGAQHFAPLAYLACPFLFYGIACFVASILRARLKPTKQDPDLVIQRQRWSAVVYGLFLSAFVAAILCITTNTTGPAYMLSNWFLASAVDANIFHAEATQAATEYTYGDSFSSFAPERIGPFLPSVMDDTAGFNYSFIRWFDTFIVSAVSLVLFVYLIKPVMRLIAFSSSFCWRIVSPTSLQNVIEAFLESLRLPTRTLIFREAHPFLNNAGRTLAWLVFCYAFLWWLFGFCGGYLGYAIESWMMASAVDAGFKNNSTASNWIFEPSFRIFIGSIVALYGTAPLAVTACVFLPFSSARKVALTCDGILFPQGPYLSLIGRQFRLWSDLKSLRVEPLKNPNAKATFSLDFRSGGYVKFDDQQFSGQDLKVLLDGIDRYASACTVDAEVYTRLQALLDKDRDKSASDGITDSSITSAKADQFKSTIFVPFNPGECLPNSQIRIIKQLASKPLCAVYLGRNESGQMVTVKQFYLADDTDETKALSKVFQREYELLSCVDHPGIAKVLNSFSVENSTFLVIEHRLGSDMRSIVEEHGPRSESLTLAWAKSLCEIMIYLHGREPAILHRDLTPDNVIAGEDGQLRLIDFGAAREFLEGITGTMLGKHCYVAPEQLRGEATMRSDIYSFGCTLYFLLTGRDPIALSQSSPAKSIDCSEDLDALIRDCTEFDELKRPQSFQDVLTRLNQLNIGFRIKMSKSEKVPA